jgi:hypothetical protein
MLSAFVVGRRECLRSNFSTKEFKAPVRPQVHGVGILVQTIAPAGESLKIALAELERLRQVRHECGLPTATISFKNVRKFLESSLTGDHCRVPDILPIDDGGLLLEWKVRSCTFQLESCVNGTVECSAFDDQGREYEYEPANPPETHLSPWDTAPYWMLEVPAR